jgi:hypothetical protein
MAAVAGYYEEAQGEQQGDESMEVRTNCDLIDGGIVTWSGVARGIFLFVW